LMSAARRLPLLHPVTTSGFLPRVDAGVCSGCGDCVDACPVAAVALVGSDGVLQLPAGRASIDETACLGCGLCVRACSIRAISLVRRAERVITPASSAHRVVMQAIENGTLAALVFSQQGRASHRVLAAVLGAFVKLPPLKQALAAEQLKSHYLGRVFDRARWSY
jgi:ferredoxin